MNRSCLKQNVPPKTPIGQQGAAAEIAVHATRYQVGEGGRSAAIGNVRHLDAGHLQEQHLGQERRAAGAGRRHGEALMFPRITRFTAFGTVTIASTTRDVTPKVR
jgi:hypothetical protein